jgi:F-type H+-transporting ATPase subunit epsilon
VAATFKFELVSPERVLMSEDVEQVIVNGTDGQFTVLPGHSPLISTLTPGFLEVKVGGKTQRIYVRSGFAEVDPTSLTILAERAIMADDLKGAALDGERAVATDALTTAATDEARRLATAAQASLATV